MKSGPYVFQQGKKTVVVAVFKEQGETLMLSKKMSGYQKEVVLRETRAQAPYLVNMELIGWYTT